MINPLQKLLLKPINIILALNSLRNTFQKENNDFNIKAARDGQLNEIIKDMNPKKATGPDKIPVKNVKQAASVIDSHQTNIINNEVSSKTFSDSPKLASVRLIYKKDDRNEKKL